MIWARLAGALGARKQARETHFPSVCRSARFEIFTLACARSSRLLLVCSLSALTTFFLSPPFSSAFSPSHSFSLSSDNNKDEEERALFHLLRPRACRGVEGAADGEFLEWLRVRRESARTVAPTLMEKNAWF